MRADGLCGAKESSQCGADVSGDNPDEKQAAILSGGMLVSDSKTSKRRLNHDIKDIGFTLNYDIFKH